MTAVDMLCPPVWTNLSDCGRTIGKIHPDDEQKWEIGSVITVIHCANTGWIGMCSP